MKGTLGTARRIRMRVGLILRSVRMARARSERPRLPYRPMTLFFRRASEQPQKEKTRGEPTPTPQIVFRPNLHLHLAASFFSQLLGEGAWRRALGAGGHRSFAAAKSLSRSPRSAKWHSYLRSGAPIAYSTLDVAASAGEIRSREHMTVRRSGFRGSPSHENLTTGRRHRTAIRRQHWALWARRRVPPVRLRTSESPEVAVRPRHADLPGSMPFSVPPSVGIPAATGDLRRSAVLSGSVHYSVPRSVRMSAASGDLHWLAGSLKGRRPEPDHSLGYDERPTRTILPVEVIYRERREIPPIAAREIRPVAAAASSERPPSVDVDRLSEDVMRKLSKRLRVERERRGLL